MTEKELEGAKKLIENKDVKKGSYSFIGDSNITYADIKILLDYIKQLEQENQQLKDQLEASEKARKEAIEYIKGAGEMATYTKSIALYEEELEELLDILDIDKGE